MVCSACLSKLEDDVNVRYVVNRLPIPRSWLEPYLLCHPSSLLIQTVPQAIDNTQHFDLPAGRKPHLQSHLALDFQRAGLIGVLGTRFRNYLRSNEIWRRRLGSDLTRRTAETGIPKTSGGYCSTRRSGSRRSSYYSIAEPSGRYCAPARATGHTTRYS